jgi:hypothetical protein
MSYQANFQTFGTSPGNVNVEGYLGIVATLFEGLPVFLGAG